MSAAMQAKIEAKPTPAHFAPAHTGLLQRKCADGEGPERRKKRLMLQRRSTGEAEPSEVPPIVHEALRSPGQPYDSDTGELAVSHFGHDFSKVKVHADDVLAISAPVSSAHTYTAGIIQPKLTINKPGDKYEEEADRVAEQVMRMPEPKVSKETKISSQHTFIQRRYPWCVKGTQPNEEVEDKILQKKEVFGSTPEVTQELESRISTIRGGGQPLPESIRSYFEPRFGYDFSQVRVHADAWAAETARAVNAQAYTVGRDVVFGAGEYAPGTTAGNRLMAHELAHVVQQGPNTFLPVSVGRVMLKRSPRPNIDLKNAQLMMGWILNIINKVYIDPPSRWPDDGLVSRYRDLLTMWYELTHGKETNGSVTKLEGEMFLSYYERAKAETEPILNVVEKNGGGTWRQNLLDRWYPKYSEFEKRAESEKRIIKRMETEPSTVFWLYPTPEPVSLDQFFSDVTKQNSKVVPLQRGGSGYQAGTAKAGITYYASKNEPRLLLWANPEGVFFLLDNQIYAQSLIGFSNDIILGAIIKAAQDVGPFVEFITFVVDLAISLSPVGFVYDLTQATQAAAEGRWRDAALILLPGPAIGKLAKLGKATKIGRAVFRGGAQGAKFLGKALAGTATFIGKGIRKIGEELKRGLWLVTEGAGEAGGKKAYYFLDEAENVWRAVPEEEAVAFIRCSKCGLTEVGKGESKFTTEGITELGKISKSKPGALKELAGKIHGLRKLGGQAIAVVEVRVRGVIRYVAASNASAPLIGSQKQVLKELGIEVAEEARGIKELIHAEHNIEYWVKSLRRGGQPVEVLRWGISAGEEGAYVCSPCRAIIEDLGGFIEEFGPTLGKRY